MLPSSAEVIRLHLGKKATFCYAGTMQAQIHTRVTKLLDQEQVAYRLLPHSEPVYTVEAAAVQRGVVREEMVKSILLRESNGQRYVMACISGDARLDHRAVRAFLGEDWRRLTFATGEQIKNVTGYEMGAVAPLCLPDDIPVIFDSALSSLEKVNISSGDPWAGLELPASDLIRLSGAQIADIALPA